MKEKEYHTMYKCRICGEIFDSGGITTSKIIVTKTMALLSCGANCVTDVGNPVSMLDVHFADNHYGIADFCGFSINDYKSKNL